MRDDVAPRPARVSQRERGADDFPRRVHRRANEGAGGCACRRVPRVRRGVAELATDHRVGRYVHPSDARVPHRPDHVERRARGVVRGCRRASPSPPPRRRGRLQLPPGPELHEALAGLRAAGAALLPRDAARLLLGFPRGTRSNPRAGVPSRRSSRLDREPLREAPHHARPAPRRICARIPPTGGCEILSLVDPPPPRPTGGPYSRAPVLAAVRSSTGEGGDEPASFAPAAARRAMGERDATRRFSANARPTLRKGNPPKNPGQMPPARKRTKGSQLVHVFSHANSHEICQKTRDNGPRPT